jgi:hypothetical protein
LKPGSAGFFYDWKAGGMEAALRTVYEIVTGRGTPFKNLAVLPIRGMGKPIRKSNENPEVIKIYNDFLGKPLGELSHKLLHTTYQIRERT